MSKPLTILGISGSLRKASTNTGLLRCAQALAPAGMTIEVADISDIPFFNADVAAEGQPAAVKRLVDQISAADGLLLATAEYNYSMAPALKNALDWASRVPENTALNGKPAALMGAGGGMGSSRAQYHLRQMCVYVNILPLAKPEVFSNAFSDTFDSSGSVVSQDIKNQISGLLAALQIWIERLK